jgi:hypothetical protein
MARELRPIDITHVPALRELIAELAASNEPRVLRADSEDLAILTPVRATKRRRRGRAKTAADYEAFLASAGGWKELVDTEQLKADIAESRRSSRPPVEL